MWIKNSFLKFFMIGLCGALLTGCKKKEVEPGQKDAFIKYYGGGLEQEGGKAAQTPDGGYIFAGTTSSFGNGGKDMYVVKTDAYGNIEWTKTFGGPGDDEGRDVHVTQDGGYIVCGAIADTSRAKPFDMYLVKLASNGSPAWSRTFGSVTENDWAYGVENTIDGGYAVIGSTTKVIPVKSDGQVAGPDDITDVIFLKTDASGNKEWETVYGFNSPDKGSAIQQLNDSVYYTAGTRLGVNQDMTVVRGREQSGPVYTPYLYINKSIPVSEPSIANAADIVLVPDGIVVTGTTLPGVAGTDIYLLKLDLNGNKQWIKTFSASDNDIAASVALTSGNGLIISGTVSTADDGSQIYLIKTDANGTLEWTQKYGGDGNDHASSVEQTADGGYIVSGVAAFGGSGTGANNVMCLIKTNAKGELVK